MLRVSGRKCSRGDPNGSPSALERIVASVAGFAMVAHGSHECSNTDGAAGQLDTPIHDVDILLVSFHDMMAIGKGVRSKFEVVEAA